MNEKLELMSCENANEEIEDFEEDSKMGTGLAMLIGGGLTLAVIAVGKKLKKIWSEHKAQKESDGVIDVAYAKDKEEVVKFNKKSK